MAELTPLMKQYNSVKEEYGDAIVLFRLGDFYEMFGEDARIASGILQIALTTRDKNKDSPMPMCGIPHFASENYITKLVKAGHKVAICEQMEDPSQAKGIVRREVVKVVTPGTHTPDNPKANAYIMSIVPQGARHGIAVADVSTGEFTLYETDRPLEDEVTTYEPVEVVLPDGLSEDLHYSSILDRYFISRASELSFDYTEAYRNLLAHFRVASLEGFGCEGMTAAVSAAGGLLSYLQDTQKESVSFKRMRAAGQSDRMVLDASVQRNLELLRNLRDGSAEGTLLWALDETLTPMGGRFIRGAILKPLLDMGQINLRQSAVKYLIEDFELIDRLRHSMRSVQDIERLSQRVATGSASARDMVALRSSIEHLPDISAALANSVNEHLKSLGDAIADLAPLTALIERSIVDHPPQGIRDGGIIRDGYSAEIDELRNISVNAKDYISSIEADERKKTGISSLKVGYNRIHGYYIEVTKSNLDLVPERYIRKQTLVGGERFETSELKNYEAKVLGAEDKLKALELAAFKAVVEEAAGYIDALGVSATQVAEADFLVSLAIVAKRSHYCRPKISSEPVVKIIGGRHPVIEKLPISERFIPNDVLLDDSDHRLLVITGPNMAGKSTYMRQCALICLMAQMGGFVPADEAMIGIVDRIFTRIGASDYLTSGQSTFMVEMVETANILNNATARSLILLDEVGRGTSTFDGISIAWATAEHITKQIRARTLFATHYNELTDLPHKIEGAKNFNTIVKEWGEEIVFMRKVEPGPADKSYGIHVARLAGLPDEVLARAREVLKELEQQHRYSTVNYSQMDLFAPPVEMLGAEVGRLDPDKMSPADLASAIKKIKRMFNL